jgi:hypothetical protein
MLPKFASASGLSHPLGFVHDDGADDKSKVRAGKRSQPCSESPPTKRDRLWERSFAALGAVYVVGDAASAFPGVFSECASRSP